MPMRHPCWTRKHCKEMLKKRWANAPTPSERFWAKVKVGAPSECWLWLGGKCTKGYGTFKFQKRTEVASRFAYMDKQGSIPKGLCVLHKCDNPSCVNPSHLWLGDHQANVDDKFAKNRQRYLKGNEHPRTKYSDAFVNQLRKEFKAGATGVELARKHNIPYSSTLKLLYCRVGHKKVYKYCLP